MLDAALMKKLESRGDIMDYLHLGQGLEVGTLVSDVLTKVAERVVGDDETGQALVTQLDDT